MMRFFPHTGPTRRESTAQLLEDAAGWHRKAIGYFKDAEAAARARESDSAAATRTAAAKQSALLQRVNDLTKSVLPGWLGDPLTHADFARPFGQDALVGQFTCVRVGETMPIAGATFPVGAPFLGAGHLVIDKDGKDPAVSRWLRGILLRSLAAVPADQLRVLTIDGATLGEVFAPFRRLFAAEAWDVPATDAAGLRAVMEQAERHVKALLAGKHEGPQVLLIATAGLPAGISLEDLSRLERLAMVGASRRMHLVIAGWPPAGMRTQAVPRLHDTTYLTAASSGRYSISRPAALRQLGEGGSDGTIRLDKGPDNDVVDHVCRRSLSTAAWADRPDFGSVTVKRFWQLSSAAGLTAVIGKNRYEQCTLDLNDETPHMLIGGRSGAGKTNFLLVLLCSLATYYAPNELAMYLLDFKEGVSFSAFTPSTPGDPWLPHAHTVGLESDREYGLAVLAGLTQEMSNRARLFRNASVTTIERYRRGDPTRLMPRLLVVVDEFQVLLAGNDHIAREAVSFLERLARQGRSHGIHLILASQTLAGIDALNAKRESIFGQFPLRIALPGGGGVLQPGNTAADAIGVGAAIVNSSAGLTGSNTITYIPQATHDSVAAVVQALWQNGRAQLTAPPAVFDGSAEYRLEDCPDYCALGGH